MNATPKIGSIIQVELLGQTSVGVVTGFNKKNSEMIVDYQVGSTSLWTRPANIVAIAEASDTSTLRLTLETADDCSGVKLFALTSTRSAAGPGKAKSLKPMTWDKEPDSETTRAVVQILKGEIPMTAISLDGDQWRHIESCGLLEDLVSEALSTNKLACFANAHRNVFASKLGPCLREHGWGLLAGEAALAIKSFDTAVGKKDAHVYLQDWGRDSESYVLAGDYQSEGRNCLEPHGVLIPKNASDDEIVRLTTQFAVNADQVVADTYAAQLHRPRG